MQPEAADEFLQDLGKAMAAMEKEQKSGAVAGGAVRGGLVELHDFDRLLVMGDIHGDMRAMSSVLDLAESENLFYPRNKLVFLGDYVDRGSDSVGILQRVCQLKHRHPDSVVLMRGNHEAPSEFPFSSHDLPYAMKDRFGPEAKAAYSKVLSFFRMLTLAVVVKGSLLLVHGGLPTDPDVAENYQDLVATAQENHVRNRVMEELLWNDPRPIEGQAGWEESRRGIGRHFGRAVTERWLAATGTRIIVRGHEPCPGYKIDHGGKVMTIFTSKEAYPGYAAACILIGRAQLASVSSADDLVQHVVKL